MKKYLKFLFTKRPWAVIVNIFVLAFLTVGLPSYNNGSWEVHNVWDIEEVTTSVFLALFILIVGVASLFQVHDEFVRN